jgi:hypothetical protein
MFGEPSGSIREPEQDADRRVEVFERTLLPERCAQLGSAAGRFIS